MDTYIISASLEKDFTDTMIIVTERNAQHAHDRAVALYRRNNNLPSTRHVFTRTIHRGTIEREVQDLYTRLMDKFQEHKDEDQPEKLA